MIQKIDFLTVTNQYSSTHSFTQGFSKAFEKMGIRTRIFKMDTPEARDHLLAIAADPPDLTCSFSYIGFTSSTVDQFLPDYLNCPHLTYWIDGPIYSLPLLRSAGNYISIVDKLDLQGLQSIGDNRILFLPHAVEHAKSFSKADRPYDLVLSASFLDFEERIQGLKDNFSDSVTKVILLAKEIALTDTSASITLAITRALKELKMGKLEIPFEKIYFEVEYICKGQDRVALIQDLQEFNIHIFGSNSGSSSWKKYAGNLKNITIHAPHSYLESLELMKQAKIVLNSSPQFRHGSHERIFNAISQGAAVVTNENSYLFDEFGDGSGILYYHPGNTEGLKNSIREYLSNDLTRLAHVECGFNKLMQSHTWDVRASTLLSRFNAKV